MKEHRAMFLYYYDCEGTLNAFVGILLRETHQFYYELFLKEIIELKFNENYYITDFLYLSIK